MNGGPGPRVRTDIIDIYVFRAAGAGVEVLQLRRNGAPMAGSWQPIMGHIEPGESAASAAWRELREETGLTPECRAFGGMWALEQVSPFFLAEADAIVMSPRFAVRVGDGWAPTLNAEHDAWRWIAGDHAAGAWMWPGQAACVSEIAGWLLAEDAWGEARRAALRLRAPW